MVLLQSCGVSGITDAMVRRCLIEQSVKSSVTVPSQKILSSNDCCKSLQVYETEILLDLSVGLLCAV